MGDGECNSACAGDMTVTCGGGATIDLYDLNLDAGKKNSYSLQYFGAVVKPGGGWGVGGMASKKLSQKRWLPSAAAYIFHVSCPPLLWICYCGAIFLEL